MIAEIAAVAETVAKVSAEVAEAAGETADILKEATADISKRVDVASKGFETKEIVPDISKRIKASEQVADVTSGKELTPMQAKELVSKGMSPGIIKDCTFKDGVYNLKTVNEKLDGSTQLESGIRYEKKIVDLNGLKVEGVFPKFESAFTAQLSPEQLLSPDRVQFSECNSQLQNAIKENPALKSQFTPRQLEQISDGRTPGGFTWHHNEDVGKMELVNTEKHDLAKHTGGRAVWGGGGAAR